MVITQLMCSTPCSSPTIVGSDGARIVWFSEDMSITTTKPKNMARMRFLLSCLASPTGG